MTKCIACGHLIITNLVVAGSSRWMANDVSALIQPYIGGDSKRAIMSAASWAPHLTARNGKPQVAGRKYRLDIYTGDPARRTILKCCRGEPAAGAREFHWREGTARSASAKHLFNELFPSHGGQP